MELALRVGVRVRVRVRERLARQNEQLPGHDQTNKLLLVFDQKKGGGDNKSRQDKTRQGKARHDTT